MFPLLLFFISLLAMVLGWLSLRLFNGLRGGAHMSPWGVVVERGVQPTAYWFSIAFFCLFAGTLAVFVALMTQLVFSPFQAR
jgi:hypothetical protein